MPSGVVSGVGQGTGALDGDGDCRRKFGRFGVNVGHPNGDSVA